MTLFTPCAGLPYPERTDPPDVQKDMMDMALAVDTAICGTSESSIPVGAVIPWYDTGNSPLPVGKLRCDGASFSAATFPDLATHLGNTIVPDLRGRFLRGADATFVNGQEGGSNTSSAPAHTHTLRNHTHSNSHNHGSASTNTTGNHAHSIAHDHPNTGSSSDTHSHVTTVQIVYNGGGGTLGIADGNVWGGVYGAPLNLAQIGTTSDAHTHTVNIPNYTGNSNTTGNHSHTFDMPNYSGNTGAPSNNTTGETGSGSAYSNLPPFTGIVYLMQAI